MSMGLRPVLPDPTPESQQGQQRGADSIVPPPAAPTAADIASASSASFASFQPEFIRVPPPILANDSLVWLNPIDAPGLLWDDSMSADTSEGSKVRELMNLCSSPMSAAVGAAGGGTMAFNIGAPSALQQPQQ